MAPLRAAIAEGPDYVEAYSNLGNAFEAQGRAAEQLACAQQAAAIAGQLPTRAACGLPAEGGVFCCFNNSYKITPAVFAVWMRLLAAVPGSGCAAGGQRRRHRQSARLGGGARRRSAAAGVRQLGAAAPSIWRAIRWPTCSSTRRR